jgi:hypothetical protein
MPPNLEASQAYQRFSGLSERALRYLQIPNSGCESCPAAAWLAQLATTLPQAGGFPSKVTLREGLVDAGSTSNQWELASSLPHDSQPGWWGLTLHNVFEAAAAGIEWSLAGNSHEGYVTTPSNEKELVESGATSSTSGSPASRVGKSRLWFEVERRRLHLDNREIRVLRGGPSNQTKLLATFQKRSWPDEIAFTDLIAIGDEQKIRQTVTDANRQHRRKGVCMSFRFNHLRRVVTWEIDGK